MSRSQPDGARECHGDRSQHHCGNHQELLARGLVRRRRARGDARAYEVTLTPEGEQVLASAEPVIAAVEKALLDELPKEDRDCFVASLERLSAAQVSRLS